MQVIKIEDNDAAETKNITFRNNLVIQTAYTGAFAMLLGGNNTQLYHNTIDVGDSHKTTGFRMICGGDSDVHFYNNIIQGAYYSSGTIHSDYNIWGSTPPANFSEGSHSLINVNLSSLFVDRQNSDYRPLMSSPACNGSINPIGVAVGALPCVG